MVADILDAWERALFPIEIDLRGDDMRSMPLHSALSRQGYCLSEGLSLARRHEESLWKKTLSNAPVFAGTLSLLSRFVAATPMEPVADCDRSHAPGTSTPTKWRDQIFGYPSWSNGRRGNRRCIRKREAEGFSRLTSRYAVLSSTNRYPGDSVGVGTSMTRGARVPAGSFTSSKYPTRSA